MPITAPAIEYQVPASVQETSQVSNGVMVEGGSNWDLSRTAVPTPIAPYALSNEGISSVHFDTQIKANSSDSPSVESILKSNGIPVSDPLFSIQFKESHYKLSKKEKSDLLKKVKKGTSVFIISHPAALEPNRAKLGELRAKEIALFLKSSDRKIVRVLNMAEVSSPIKAKVDIILK